MVENFGYELPYDAIVASGAVNIKSFLSGITLEKKAETLPDCGDALETELCF